ncbi:MAG: hypothetical protein V2I97_23870, partial [Desulfococcaceae bacterium]|nr:hypothetical protein [Desulfococcaceae bacterium]
QAFKWAESRINEKKYTHSDKYGIFAQIQRWLNKEINDSELSAAMISAWDKLAYAVIEPAEKSVSFFQVAMDVAKNILTSLGLDGLIAKEAYSLNKVEIAMSGEQTKTIPEAVSLLFDDSNIVTVYSDICVDKLNILEMKEGNERLASLIQDMTDLPRFYMMGWGLIGENKVDIIPKAKRYTETPVSIDIPVKNCDALVFALSSRKIMKKLEEKKEISESELPEIKLLIYLPEEKS